MYAYVLMHFGSNPKYLEYEIYTIIMLKSITLYDIIYMYSIIDTPKIFIKIMKKLKIKTIGFDDSLIVEKSKKFKSVYEHFNTLRTCSFIYANILDKYQYQKICIVESDIIFNEGMDGVFNLNTPSVLINSDDLSLNMTNYNKLIDKTELAEICKKASFFKFVTILAQHLDTILA